MFGLEEVPLGGPAVAAVILAFGSVTAMFIRYMFKEGNRSDRSNAYAFGLLEKQVEGANEAVDEAEARWNQAVAEKQAEQVKYERLLRESKSETQAAIRQGEVWRTERDMALLELAKLRQQG